MNKEKKCPHCKEIKSAKNFRENPKLKSGLTTYCRQCESKRASAWQKKKKNGKLFVPLQIEGKKYCRKCKHYLTFDNFSSNNYTKSGLASNCKKCVKDYMSDYRAKNPGKSYRYNPNNPVYKDTNPEEWRVYQNSYMAAYIKKPINYLRCKMSRILIYNGVEKPTSCSCCKKDNVKTFAYFSNSLCQEMIKKEKLILNEFVKKVKYVCAICRAKMRDKNKLN